MYIVSPHFKFDWKNEEINSRLSTIGGINSRISVDLLSEEIATN